MGRASDERGADGAAEPTPSEPARGVELSPMDIDGVQFVVVAVPRDAPMARLSPAEQEVVRLVLDGRSNREIAAARGVSVKTVANQLRAVYEKLGICSRFELAALE
ncbi:MAG: helix-turn-helix transcriptional regulator [Myxococcota bacterium]